jgi:hypothetical protein
MKKLLLLITLVLVIGLGACESAPDNTELLELENRVVELESKVDELEQILVDIEVIEGLNGQKEYYIPDAKHSIFNVSSVGASDIELLGTELDKASAPSYVLDENGDYVPFDDVVQKLVTKYYGNVDVEDSYIGFQIKIVLSIGDMSQEEFMAKTIMLINEISQYDFYIIGGSELYIQLHDSSYGYVKLPIQTMRSSFITITPEVIYNGLYEIQLMQLNYDKAQVQTLYDEYVASGLYDGYVLDYK